MKKKTLIPFIVMAFFLFYVGSAISIAYQKINGNFLEKTVSALSVDSLKVSPFIILQNSNSKSVLFALGVSLLPVLYYFYYYAFAKNYRHGEEHGSARWGDYKEVEPFARKNNNENIILSKNIGIALYNKGMPPENQCNKNVLLVGGSGSGKTRFYVKPNLLQSHNCCYVVTDPKGTCMEETGNALVAAGYEIKYLNTIFFDKSMHYNPFHYIKSEKDILNLIDALISNTKGDGKGGDDFWEKAERLLFTALIGYVIYEAEENERNFDTFLTLFDGLEVREDDENYVSPIDILFEDLENEKPTHFAVRQYKKFKMAAGKTAKSILISCAARLSPFDIEEVREMLRYDELELDKIGFEKTALFIIQDDTVKTFNFLVGIFYSQFINLLIRNADANKGRLPIHTRFLFDEFANIFVPDIDRISGQIRSREISMTIILQNPEQLKAIYKEKAKVIMGNCDTLLFLGSDELEAGKLISEKAGKETVTHNSSSESKGKSGSWSESEQILGRDLIAAAEVRKLPVKECIVFVKGLPPFKDEKYPLEEHPNYKLTGDYDDKLLFYPYKKDKAITFSNNKTIESALDHSVLSLDDFMQDVESITQIEIDEEMLIS